MKGPGMRLDLDVRRHWRCPVCGTERHTPGQVTFVRCHFCKEHPAMSLVEQPRPFRPPPPPLDLVIDLHPDDVDAPAFVPPHLRDVEPTPAGETITEILTEPEASAEQTQEQTAAEKSTEQQKASKEPAGETIVPEETPKTRKKKRRGRRQRRRNRASDSAGEAAPVRQDGAGKSTPDDDSFGAGVDA